MIQVFKLALHYGAMPLTTYVVVNDLGFETCTALWSNAIDHCFGCQ